MDKKIDPEEIINPRKTMARRQAEAEGESPRPGGLTPPASGEFGQREFLYGSKPKPQSKVDKARRQKSLEELLKKRDRELRSSADEFEEEFSADSDTPLTDAVRAARREASSAMDAEGSEYAAAYRGAQA